MYSSFLRRVIAGSVLFLIAVACCVGCSDSPTINVDDEPSEDALIRYYSSQTPRADARAEQMAALHSKEYIAADLVYEHISHDLQLIEATYPDEILQALQSTPDVPVDHPPTMPYRLPWRYYLNIETHPAYAARMVDGTDSAFAHLFNLFDGDTISVYTLTYVPDYAVVTVRLRGNWVMPRVAERFAEIPSVKAVDLWWPSYIPSTVLSGFNDNGEREYIFDGVYDGIPYHVMYFRVDRSGHSARLVDELTSQDFARYHNGIDSPPTWFTVTRRQMRLKYSDAGDHYIRNYEYVPPGE